MHTGLNVGMFLLSTGGLKGQGQDPVAGQAEGEGPVKVEILDIGQDLVKSQDPVEGQDPVQAQLPDKVQDPVKAQPAVQGVFPFSKLGFCPRIEIRCRLLNPNRCLIDAQCPGFQKCCRVCGVKSCADPR